KRLRLRGRAPAFGGAWERGRLARMPCRRRALAMRLATATASPLRLNPVLDEFADAGETPALPADERFRRTPRLPGDSHWIGQADTMQHASLNSECEWAPKASRSFNPQSGIRTRHSEAGSRSWASLGRWHDCRSSKRRST